MPSGPVSLTTAAKYGGDQIAEGIIETLIQESPLLEMLPWTSFSGNALQKNVEVSLPDVQFRQVNAGYSASYGSNDKTYWGVAILGGEIKVDNFEVDVVASEADLEADQYAKLGKSNSMRFDYEAINGDGSGNGFKGLRTLIDEGYGQESVHSATGAALTLEALDIAIDLFRNQGMPDAMLINRRLRRKITNLAQTTISGTVLIDVGTDVFGRKVNVYDGIPMRILGDGRTSAGATVPVLDFNEDPGDGGADTASIYMAKFTKDDVTGLLGKGGSFEVRRFGEMESAPQRLGRLEWYPGLAVFNKYSAVRISGITDA